MWSIAALSPIRTKPKQAMLGVPAATLQAPWRGKRANRRGHGCRRAEKFAGRHDRGDHRHRRPGRRHEQKPVGLVLFCRCGRDGRRLARSRRFGKIGRRRVRLRSVAEALNCSNAGGKMRRIPRLDARYFRSIDNSAPSTDPNIQVAMSTGHRLPVYVAMPDCHAGNFSVSGASFNAQSVERITKRPD